MTNTKSVFNLAFFTVLSRIVGFVRVIVIGALLGTSIIGNTFQSTNSVSNVLFDLLVAGALSAALVPQLSVALHKSKKDFDEVVSSLFGVVSLFLGLITILGFIFAPQLSSALFNNAPKNVREDQIHVGTVLIRFFIPQVFFYGIGAISVAALSAKRIFSPAAYAPIASSVVLILGLAIFRVQTDNLTSDLSTSSMIILGLTGTLACLAFIAIPLFIAIKNEVSFKPKFNFRLGLNSLKSSTWAIAIQAAAAIVLGAAIFIGNELAGAVVAYQIGFVFLLAPYAVISQSFATVVLPDISVQAATNDEDNKVLFSKNVSNAFSWTYIPLAIISAYVIAIARPLSQLISFGAAKDGSKLFELILIALFIGLLPYGLFQTAARIFFAKGNVKTPALMVLVVSVILSLSSIFVAKSDAKINIITLMGLTHTGVYLISGLLLTLMLKKAGDSSLPNKTSIAIIVSAIIIGFLGYGLEVAIDPTTKLSSILYVGVVTLILVLATLLSTPKALRSKYFNKLRKKQNV